MAKSWHITGASALASGRTIESQLPPRTLVAFPTILLCLASVLLWLLRFLLASKRFYVLRCFDVIIFVLAQHAMLVSIALTPASNPL